MNEMSYNDWLAEFTRLAQARDLAWLMNRDSPGLRAAYDKGTSPEEELNELADQSEWRGCGCGGNGG